MRGTTFHNPAPRRDPNTTARTDTTAATACAGHCEWPIAKRITAKPTRPPAMRRPKTRMRHILPTEPGDQACDKHLLPAHVCPQPLQRTSEMRIWNHKVT